MADTQELRNITEQMMACSEVMRESATVQPSSDEEREMVFGRMVASRTELMKRTLELKKAVKKCQRSLL